MLNPRREHPGGFDTNGEDLPLASKARVDILNFYGVAPSMEAYLMRRRQCLLMELGQIEELLGLERTKPPREKDG